MSGHIQKNRILQVAIHAIVWGLIIGLPLFFFEENFAGRRMIRYWDFFIIPFSFYLFAANVAVTNISAIISNS